MEWNITKASADGTSRLTVRFDDDDEKRRFLIAVREAVELSSVNVEAQLDNPAFAGEAKTLNDEEVDSIVLFDNQLYESQSKLMYYLSMIHSGMENADRKQLVSYLEEVIDESIQMLDNFRNFKKMCHVAFKRQKGGYEKLLNRFSRAFHVINVYETILLNYIDNQAHPEGEYVPDTPASHIAERQYYDLSWNRKINMIKSKRKAPIQKAE